MTCANADSEELRHVGLLVSCLSEYLNRVPLGHVDHPFRRCLVQRLLVPEGSAQSGRKRGGQNLLNPQEAKRSNISHVQARNST